MRPGGVDRGGPCRQATVTSAATVASTSTRRTRLCLQLNWLKAGLASLPARLQGIQPVMQTSAEIHSPRSMPISYAISQRMSGTTRSAVSTGRPSPS